MLPFYEWIFSMLIVRIDRLVQWFGYDSTIVGMFGKFFDKVSFYVLTRNTM